MSESRSRGITGPTPKPLAPRFRLASSQDAYTEHQSALAAQRKAAKAQPLKLETAADVTEAIRDVVRQVADGTVSAIEGVRRTRSLQALLDAMTSSQLQVRLDRIEAALLRDRRTR